MMISLEEKDNSINELNSLVQEKISELEQQDKHIAAIREDLKIKQDLLTKKEKMCENFQKKLNEILN